jgi:hypothetical protein
MLNQVEATMVNPTIGSARSGYNHDRNVGMASTTMVKLKPLCHDRYGNDQSGLTNPWWRW